MEKAIDECIKKGILAEFLRKNRAEVLRVSIFEYDEEEHMRQEREESRQEGIEQVNDLYDKSYDLNRKCLEIFRMFNSCFMGKFLLGRNFPR